MSPRERFDGRSWWTRWLRPLTPAYRAGLAAHRALTSMRPVFARSVPVVLVGNLTVGGTGKTPLVAVLAERLAQRGLAPAVVSRGYGRRGTGGPLTVCAGDGPLLGPDEAGDEPWMLAGERPHLRVVVDADRVRGASHAVDHLGARSVVLDDGFQQRFRFPRGCVIATLNAAAPFGSGLLLPAGTLREPPEALAAARAVVVTHADEATAASRAGLAARLRELAPAAAVAETVHELASVEPADGGGRRPVSWLRGRSVVALSGIGYPAGFERLLRNACGRDPVSAAFPDHHRFSAADLREVFRRATIEGCEAVVTTAKDLGRLPRERGSSLPLLVARMRLAFREGESRLYEALEARGDTAAG